MILIYTTHPNKEAAEKISTLLLQERLIACVNYLPIESAYWWDGNITQTSEIVTLYKTQELHWIAVQERIKELHSYKTPCIIKLAAQAEDLYQKWITTETKKEP